MSGQPIFTDAGHYWPLFLLVPLLGAALGYVINMLTARLRLAHARLPGSVRRHNARLAGLHAQLVADGLVSAQELFARVDPRRLADEIEKPLLRAVDELVVEVATQYRPGLWELLPLRVKQLLINQVRDQAPGMVVELVEEMSVDATEVFHTEHLVRSRLGEDADLLTRLTTRITEPVTGAAQQLGALVGLLLGGLAVVVLGLTGSLLVLPIAGLLIGAAAYWLAPLVLAHRFTASRSTVASGYAEVIAKEVLNFGGIVRELTTGPRSPRLAELIRKLVHRKIDAQLNLIKPFVVAGLGSRRFQNVKQTVSTKVTERIPEILRPAENYVTSVMDVRNTIGHRVRTMPRLRYALLLRPNVQLDRWQVGPLCAVLSALLGGLGMLLLALG